MRFKSKKDILFNVIILGANALLIRIIIVMILNEGIVKSDYWNLILILGLVGLLFWLYFGTNYELTKENEFVYKSGPIKGKININKITEIIKGRTMWAGIKPATSRKGLIIKSDTHSDIYISPKTNELFIEKILELNNKIKITE